MDRGGGRSWHGGKQEEEKSRSPRASPLKQSVFPSKDTSGRAPFPAAGRAQRLWLLWTLQPGRLWLLSWLLPSPGCAPPSRTAQVPCAQVSCTRSPAACRQPRHVSGGHAAGAAMGTAGFYKSHH